MNLLKKLGDLSQTWVRTRKIFGITLHIGLTSGDIGFFEQGAYGAIGTRRFISKASAIAINPGEPVYVASLAAPAYVEAFSNNGPSMTAAWGYAVGIAQNPSTHTSTAGGTVDVFPAIPGVVYEILPKVAATYGLTRGSEVQVTYNSQVGNRVLIDLTSGAYTLLAADAAANGCVVEYRDVFRANGKVAFTFRQNVTYFSGL